MTTSRRKIRIAVPYTERMFALPNCGFSTLAEALWNTCRDDCEVVKLDASELVARSDYDAVIFIRRFVLTEDLCERCRAMGKLVGYWVDDLHRWCLRVPCASRDRARIFDKADVIFVTYLRQFAGWHAYRRFEHKVVWSPWSVPERIFEFSQPWETRSSRILVAGNCGRSYPLRRRLYEYARDPRQSMADPLDHPGYDTSVKKHGTTGDDFYRLLGSYRGAAATTASVWIPRGYKVDYTVAKYFEIPACGCLTFMEKTPDLMDLGFREGEHYVSINRWNYKKRFEAVHSPEAKDIAKAAQELIRARHTHSHRVQLMLDEITRRFR